MGWVLNQTSHVATGIAPIAHGNSADAVVELSRLKGEPEWLRQRRLESWELYQRIPMPTLKDEEWRRTDIRRLRIDEFVPFSPDGHTVSSPHRVAEGLSEMIAECDDYGGILGHQDNGAVFRELSADLASQGVIFTDLDSAVREYPELVERYFMTEAVKPDFNKFSALHGALFGAGTVLYVPEGVQATVPLWACHWTDGEGLGIFPHTLVIADRDSEVVFIEEHRTPALLERSFRNSVVELVVKDGARLKYVSIQETSQRRGTWNFVVNRAVVGRDATVTSVIVALGGGFNKANIESAMVQPGARSEMYGLLFGNEKQFFDHHTLQDHLAPNTTSDLLYKDALADGARSVYSGLIRAHGTAQRTDAVQTNRNLLLSDGCRADSIPNLEIETNDLRCTHASTVSPVDEDQIFYLVSRGLDRRTATQLILEGFFEPVLDVAPLGSLHDRLLRTIAGKIGLGDLPGVDLAESWEEVVGEA
jgi:Fe-S cluster assembly protein SufD